MDGVIEPWDVVAKRRLVAAVPGGSTEPLSTEEIGALRDALMLAASTAPGPSGSGFMIASEWLACTLRDAAKAHLGRDAQLRAWGTFDVDAGTVTCTIAGWPGPWALRFVLPVTVVVG